MIEALCDPDSGYDYAAAPFRVGVWRCATDGKSLLASRDDVRAPAARGRVASLAREWLACDAPLVLVERLEALRERMGRPRLPVACPQCRGEGALGNGGWAGSADDAVARDVCWLCDDSGCVTEESIARAVRVGPHLYDCARIAWLLAHADSGPVSARQSGETLVLRWPGGAAALARCTSADAIAETWVAT